MRKPKIALRLLPAAGIGASTQAQIHVRNIGNIGRNFNMSAPVNFRTGEELLVLRGRLTRDITAGSGHGLVFHTLDGIGGQPDTEIAIYDATTGELIACNDDAALDNPTKREVNSYLAFGDAEGAPTNGIGYNGTSRHSPDEFVNPRDLPAGEYFFVVSPYSVIWHDHNLRVSKRLDINRGQGAVVMIQVK